MESTGFFFLPEWKRRDADAVQTFEKLFFKYDKYDGICPQCAYFNRPPGMEEVDLFEDDKRFQAENYVLPQMEGIHMELHKKYDSDKKPHKKKKTAKK